MKMDIHPILCRYQEWFSRMAGGFYGDDYERYRLLGYKNTVSTSPETYYITATKPIQVMIWKI
jgi:hypothetical protein